MPSTCTENTATSGTRSPKMQKRVETKPDGRLLIYYTFSGASGDNSSSKTDKAAK